MKICGIYKITNLIENKHYIGQSIHIYQRWTKHKNRAFNKNDKSYESLLYQDIRKYGLENFDFSILEICPREKLDEKEIFYIQKYNSYKPNGYNKTLGGSGKQEIPEYVYFVIEDLQNSILTIKEIADKYNIGQTTVYAINSGKTHFIDDYDYPIRQLIYNQKFYCPCCGKEMKTKNGLCVECAHLLSRKVKRPTREELKEMIRKFSFVQIGEKYNVSDNAIRKWCDTENLPRKKKEINSYSDEEWKLI